MKYICMILALLPCFSWAMGADDPEVLVKDADNSIQVFASNYPLAYAVTEIAGDKAELYWPFPEDVDPAFWEPGREELRRLQEMDLLIFNGAGYEAWENNAFLEPGRIVRTSNGFEKDFITAEDQAVHSHSGGAEHSHGGTAFTLWLDLSLYEKQCAAVFEGLSRSLPDSAEQEFESRYRELVQEVQQLHGGFLRTGESLRDQVFLASHPVYQYFAEAYGLHITSFLWEPDVFPSEEEWSLLEEELLEKSYAYMIWESVPLPETEARLRKLGIKILVITPAFNRGRASEDVFISQMAANLEVLRQAVPGDNQ